MPTQEQLRRARAASQQERANARRMLETLLRSGQSSGYGSHLPTGPYSASTNVFPGGFTAPYGSTPTEADLDRFMETLGGNRAMKRQMNMLNGPTARKPGVTSVSTRGQDLQAGAARTTGEQTVLEKLLASLVDAEDKANAANDARGLRIEGLLGEPGGEDGLYGRTMGAIGNFGKAASADLEERAKNTFGSIQANLSARGLGNSTIVDAFRQKNATDLAREQQRLSEMVDARRIAADTDLTKNFSGFLERQEDVARDPYALLPLLMQYGQSGQGQGYADVQQQLAELRGELQQGRYEPMQRAPQIPQQPQGVSPWAAMQMQGNLNAQFAPMLQAAWGGGGGGYAPPPQYDLQPMEPPVDNFNAPGVVAARQRRKTQEAKVDAARRARIRANRGIGRLQF